MNDREFLLDAIQRLSAEATASLEQRLEETLGITTRDAAIISLMGHDDDVTTVSFREIEDNLGISQSSASRAVSRLADRGLVTYSTLPTDARVKQVALTANGAAMARRIAEAKTLAADELSGVERVLAVARGGTPTPAPDTDGETDAEGGIIAFGEGFLEVASDARLVSDILYVRDALEPAVLLEATTLRDDIDIAECRGLIGLMGQRLDDPASFYRADWALHRRIAQICRNDVLKSYYLTLLTALERQAGDIVGADELDGYLQRRLIIHEEIVEALASGDPARMGRAATAHQYLGSGQRDPAIAPS